MFKYEQKKVLGRGGFGAALLAARRDTKELVVIKEVKLSGLSRKEQDDARKEAAFLQSLHHPNIVAYIESFVEAGKLYIVMEFADGAVATDWDAWPPPCGCKPATPPSLARRHRRRPISVAS